MAAIQPDTSTCLGGEQTAIRKDKPQVAHLSQVCNIPPSVFGTKGPPMQPFSL